MGSTTPVESEDGSSNSNLELPPLPTRPQQCHFFLKKKKRYCTMTTKPGLKYCGEHMVMDASVKNTQEERIPCPLDNRHTIQRSRLSQHVLKCNANVPPPSCHNLNINLVKKVPSPVLDADLTLDTFIHTCDMLYQRFLDEEGPIPMETVDVHEHACQTKHGLKHTLQHAALFGLLRKYGDLTSRPLCIEFGAGKGEFSHYIQTQTADLGLSYVLIDRRNFKQKFDRYFDATHCHRLCMDIKDLELLPTYPAPFVAYSKHLCGAATDLTLRCVVQANVTAMVLAMCCHQVCSLDSYVGTHLGPLFPWLTKKSSWALTHPKYRQLGYQCKRILDFGRVKWLRQRGFHVKLVQYVTLTTSPENCALVAWK